MFAICLQVVLAVLQQAGFQQTSDAASASVVLLNTCAIRENAEAKIWSRLGFYRNVKLAARRSQRQPPVVGVLGCMAERLKLRLLESDRLVDIVAGPDSYRYVCGRWCVVIVAGAVQGGAQRRTLL
jgi:tRNA A37 methylthiotransferase MiaB